MTHVINDITKNYMLLKIKLSPNAFIQLNKTINIKVFSPQRYIQTITQK